MLLSAHANDCKMEEWERGAGTGRLLQGRLRSFWKKEAVGKNNLKQKILHLAPRYIFFCFLSLIVIQCQKNNVFVVSQPWTEKQIMASWQVDVRILCVWTDSKSRHASLRMVRLINNLYGKDKMAVLPFDSISLTTRLRGSANNTHPTLGVLSLIHFECAALSREID